MENNRNTNLIPLVLMMVLVLFLTSSVTRRDDQFMYLIRSTFQNYSVALQAKTHYQETASWTANNSNQLKDIKQSTSTKDQGLINEAKSSHPDSKVLSTSDSLNAEMKSWIEKKDKQQQELRQHIHDVCKTLNLSNELTWPHPILIDNWHNIFACMNAKVGTTSWMFHFKTLIGKKASLPKNAEIHGAIYSLLSRRHFFPHDKSDWLTFLSNHSFFSFSFVRHPFDRIVSAYLNKIVDKYIPTADNVKHAEPCVREIWRMTKGNVTFPNFLKGIIDQRKAKKFNRHWARYIDKCHYCHINYDIIGKAETFAEDVQHVLLKGNLTNDIPVEAADLHFQQSSLSKSNEKPKLHGKPLERTISYFKENNITQNTIDALFEVYKPDFLLFNYSLEGF